MDNDEIRLAIAFGAAYGVLLAVGALSTIVRAIRLRRRKQPLPRLLGRDLILLGGHSAAFAGLLYAVLGHNADINTFLHTTGWWLVTMVPALVSMAVYVYFEIMVIGQ